jgi:hypothetical protein
LLVDVDSGEDVAGGGSMYVPVGQIVDDLGRSRGFEPFGDLPGRGDT